MFTPPMPGAPAAWSSWPSSRPLGGESLLAAAVEQVAAFIDDLVPGAMGFIPAHCRVPGGVGRGPVSRLSVSSPPHASPAN